MILIIQGSFGFSLKTYFPEVEEEREGGWWGKDEFKVPVELGREEITQQAGGRVPRCPTPTGGRWR